MLVGKCRCLVLIAYNREMLQDMIAHSKNFLKRRNLELCTEKTKIMVSGGREKKGKRNRNGKIRN